MTFERLPNERTLKHVLDAFEEHCNPKKNETVERYMCNMRNQYQEETFDKYVTELQLLGSTCNYGTLHDSLIRDRIVCGINRSTLRERLLRTANLTLEKTCNWERAAELTRERINKLENPSASSRHKQKQGASYKQNQCPPIKQEKSKY